MHAHKLNVNVEHDHRLAIDLPDDFPAGPAEVIVLAHARTASRAAAAEDAEAAFARLFPKDPMLGPITFHEDPTAPLGPEDWPEPSVDEAAP